jgi:hypothetical protein
MTVNDTTAVARFTIHAVAANASRKGAMRGMGWDGILLPYSKVTDAFHVKLHSRILRGTPKLFATLYDGLTTEFGLFLSRECHALFACYLSSPVTALLFRLPRLPSVSLCFILARSRRLSRPFPPRSHRG